MTSSIQVSEEAKAVGVQIMHGRLLGLVRGIDYGSIAEAIYLAMKAAEPLPQGDEFERALSLGRDENSYADFSDEAGAWNEGYTAAWAIARAALVRSKLPVGDDVRERVQDALWRYVCEHPAIDQDMITNGELGNMADDAITAIGDEAREAEPLPQGDEVRRVAVALYDHCHEAEHGEVYENETPEGQEYWDSFALAAIAALVGSKLPIDRDIERLGEALFNLSDKMRASGILSASDAVHEAYERVVAEFTAIGSQSIEGERG